MTLSKCWRASALLIASWFTTPLCAQDAQSLAEQLKGGNGQAALQLVKLGAKAVPVLIETLKSDTEPRVRSQAAWALGEIGPAAKEATPELVRALDDAEPGVAGEAASALAKLGTPAGAKLVDVIRGGKASAVHAARALKMPVKGATPALLAALNKETALEPRIAYIEALGAQGPMAAEAVPALVELVRQEGAPRVHILAALGNMGEGAKNAVPLLLELIKKKEPGPVTLHAVQAIGKIGVRDSAIAEVLLDLMKEGTQPRMALLESLGKAGKVTKESLPAIAQGMRDKDPTVRLYTAQLVGSLDPNDLAVVSVLMESMSDKNAGVRKLAAEVLLTVQPRDPSVADTLRELAARDQDAGVRKAAEAALTKFKAK
jgi:HEAT repeat protein